MLSVVVVIKICGGKHITLVINGNNTVTMK